MKASASAAVGVAEAAAGAVVWAAAEVAAIFARIQPAIQRIDLKQTSKYLSEAELERFVARLKETEVNLRPELSSQCIGEKSTIGAEGL